MLGGVSQKVDFILKLIIEKHPGNIQNKKIRYDR